MIGNHVYGYRRTWGSNPHLSARGDESKLFYFCRILQKKGLRLRNQQSCETALLILCENGNLPKTMIHPYL